MKPKFTTVLSTLFLAAAVQGKSHAPNPSKPVIVQMFGWNWLSLARECKFIGDAGYGAVQVSPPNEHVYNGDGRWFTDYQPVSYKLHSKRGTRDEFAQMVSSCHAAGVKVIADSVWNHMAGIDNGVGSDGSSFTHYNYPGLYQYQDFHHCGVGNNDDITNYSDRFQVQNCEVNNLADLATESDYVRGRLAAYAQDLMSLGVDGLRLDAAKHMPADDIANILSRISGSPYITQEVYWNGGEAVQPWEYEKNGDVQELRYTSDLKDEFLNGDLNVLKDLPGTRNWVTKANVFVADHDTERNSKSLHINSPGNTYLLATIFSLAHPYGTPTILSSYNFGGDEGAPEYGKGDCTGTGTSPSGRWRCQHRWIAVTGMVRFRNAVGSDPMTNWQSPNGRQIAFGRGDKGFVAINNSDVPWNNAFTTSLPDGTYCDVISGNGNSCSGAKFIVKGGSFLATVPPRGAIAMHSGAMNSGLY